MRDGIAVVQGSIDDARLIKTTNTVPINCLPTVHQYPYQAFVKQISLSPSVFCAFFAANISAIRALKWTFFIKWILHKPELSSATPTIQCIVKIHCAKLNKTPHYHKMRRNSFESVSYLFHLEWFSPIPFRCSTLHHLLFSSATDIRSHIAHALEDFAGVRVPSCQVVAPSLRTARRQRCVRHL